MKPHTKPLLASLALIATLQFTGCQYRSSSDTYYLIANNLKLPYWQSVSEGFNTAAKQYQVTAIVKGPDTYDAKAESDALDDAARHKPAGILISAADAVVLRNGINAALAAGIPVITVDSDDPLSNRLFFVGTNNTEAGHQGGERLAKRLNGKGNVVIYTIANQPNLDERVQGYKDVLQRYPGIKIVQTVSTGGDSGSAYDQTRALLAKSGPDKIDAFVSVESSSGDAIAEVIKRNNDQRVVIAMDASKATLDYIKDGTIDSCISQKPYTMGYVGLEEIDSVHHRAVKDFKSSYVLDAQSPYPAFVDTGSTLITKDNLFSFENK